MLPHEGLSHSAALAGRGRAGSPARRAAALARSAGSRSTAACGRRGPARLAAARGTRPRGSTARDREDAGATRSAGCCERVERGRASAASRARRRCSRNEAPVRELARGWTRARPLYARGLARLERLLSDGTGPVFRGGAGALAAELERRRPS